MLPDPVDINNFSSDISGTEIIYIKNFLSKQERRYLTARARKSVSGHGRNKLIDSRMVGYANDGIVNDKSSPYVCLPMHHDENLVETVRDINTRVRALYEDLYGVDPDRSYLEFGTVNVMGKGKGMGVHFDNGPSMTQNIDTPHGLVLYLNDTYKGGEIYYSNLGIALKPEAGSLVIHPGNKEYAHGVMPVLSGTRYATTAFTKKKMP